MPHGVGSGRKVDHSDTISPLKADIDEAFRYFWTVGETIKQLTSKHPYEVERNYNDSRREVREIMVGRIVIPIDRGPPHFNAILERSMTMSFPRATCNTDASIIPTRDIQVVTSSINQHRYSYGDKVIVENHEFDHISKQSGNLWMGPLTVERFEGNMYFLSTEDGHNFKIPVNQVYLRD